MAHILPYMTICSAVQRFVRDLPFTQSLTLLSSRPSIGDKGCSSDLKSEQSIRSADTLFLGDILYFNAEQRIRSADTLFSCQILYFKPEQRIRSANSLFLCNIILYSNAETTV